MDESTARCYRSGLYLLRSAGPRSRSSPRLQLRNLPQDRAECHQYWEKLWPDTLDIMGWSVDPEGFGVVFQRTIPDFVPSERSYAVARAAYDTARDRLTAVGLDQSGVDLWTATMTGLVAQQLSNEPGGDRWSVLVDRSVDMLLAQLAPRQFKNVGPRRSK